ncbi:hypothetical protein [Winogradskyella haliclonae]|uniref:Uncharacterized protein n=1 Tax=Winogradskyella haliclonae TaxID=2048558 RepID=A0ABQ2C303_9FLAO|nr:hypothetical protein [Winogradskyella haliclonae]GGI58453.1 hypothetical protein GCM10011444_27620 [Winogradskyella haliclonae]
MQTPSIVDVLIENITTDQALLKDAEAKITEAKEEKAEVVDRLKDYRKEIAVIAKYATDDQKEKIEALGFDSSDNNNTINTVASIAFDIVVKAKDYKIENGEWYEAYKKICTDKKEEPLSYTFFNIKCRTLFNTQRLIRTKVGDPKSSREDIISLNGRPIQKEEEQKEKEAPKKETTKTTKNDKTPKQK